MTASQRPATPPAMWRRVGVGEQLGGSLRKISVRKLNAAGER